jgi:hypothetical protein
VLGDVLGLGARRRPAQQQHRSATKRCDDSIEVLAYKLGALAGATALVRARAAGVFTSMRERFWTQTRRRLGDAAGTGRSSPGDGVGEPFELGHLADGRCNGQDDRIGAAAAIGAASRELRLPVVRTHTDLTEKASITLSMLLRHEILR